MATWLKHMNLTFGGTLGQPEAEIWSNTIRFKADIGEDDDDQGSITWTDGELETALDALVTPIRDWMNGGSSQISSQAGLKWIKLNMVNEQGKQMSQVTHRRDIARFPGAIGVPVPHWYQTVVNTMRTNTARGRAHAGRIYPPMVVAFPQGGSPYIDGTVATGLASSFATLLNACSDAINSAAVAPNLDVYPVIGSPATALGPNPGGPVLRRVTGVVVDRVGDVMHSRTRQVARLETALSPVVPD